MILALLLLATIPHRLEPRTLRESVSNVELNHVLQESGDVTFTQVIFDDDASILAWKMDKEILWSYHPARLYWWDGDKLRIVEPRAWQESWTYGDREQESRVWLPPEERKGLRKP